MPKRNLALDINKKQIIYMYLKELQTQTSIGKKFDVSQSTIRRKLCSWKISTRNTGWGDPTKSHTKSYKAYNTKYAKSKRERLYHAGLCIACGNEPIIQGIKYCKSCKERTKRRWKERRSVVIKAYGGKCVCCGETELDFLCIDHINGGGAKHKKEVGNLYSWLRKEEYPAGFQVLCWNCNHGKYTNGFCPHQQKR